MPLLKFPTTTSPFPQVALTEGDCRLYEQRAATLVRDALAEYDEYTTSKKRQLDKKQWKAVKSRENLTVHCARRSRDATTSDVVGSTPRMPPLSATTSTLAAGATKKIGAWFSSTDKDRSNWSLPPLLAVGSIAGTLDDVMFGIATFDSTAMFLKSAYTDNELVDGEVLYTIKAPTPDAPFEFVGLKWIVKTQPTGINALVWPRDVVYLESTGVLKRPNGERIGYQLMSSVPLPECTDLRDQGVLRATLSSCFLFKQLPKGVVDVYMKAHVEPNGKVSRSLAIKSTAASLIYCWKSVACAQHKKLAWRLEQKPQQSAPQTPHAATRARLARRGSQLSSCAICHKTVGAFRHAVMCALCDEPVCAKCRVHKTLHSRGAWAKTVEPRTIVACTSCIASTNQLGAMHVARAHVKAGRHWEAAAIGDDDALHRSMPMLATTPRKHSNNNSELDRRDSSERTTIAWQSERSTEPSSPDNAADVALRLSHSFAITAPITELRGAMDLDELDDALDAATAAALRPQSLPQSSLPSSCRLTGIHEWYTQANTPRLTQQEQLWLQMAELRDQAESVYQYTKKNGEEHLNSNGSARSLQLWD